MIVMMIEGLDLTCNIKLQIKKVTDSYFNLITFSQKFSTFLITLFLTTKRKEKRMSIKN